MHAGTPLLGVIAHREGSTNAGIVRACNRLGRRAAVLAPEEALGVLRPGDAVLGRLDVRDELDGVERGIWELRVLERDGVRVLNSAASLTLAHDKVATARRLREADLPHPATEHVTRADALPALEPPLVLKPRFGSWGRDVLLCEGEEDLAAALATLSRRRWFARTGAVAQRLVPPTGRDLRVVVAGGHVVGGIERIVPPREWRTNIALGASRRQVELPPAACALAVAAVFAVGADLAGVDLLPLPEGGWTVLEVNGAVDFTRQYRRRGDVFAAAADALLSDEERRSPDRLRMVTAP